MTVFWVTGIPSPQGSKRAFVVNGKPVLTESAGERQKAWRANVTYAASEAHRQAGGGISPSDTPLTVGLNFYLPRPKAAKKRARPHTRPDLDKLIRCTLDGLTDAGLIVDDARIVSIYAEKHYIDDQIYPTPGCSVQVETT